MVSKESYSDFVVVNKINNKKYHTIRTIPKSNCLIVNRGQTDDPNTHILLV
jgi:hypothetical protein